MNFPKFVQNADRPSPPNSITTEHEYLIQRNK